MPHINAVGITGKKNSEKHAGSEETHHKGIRFFFSTGSQCDLQASSHSNNQRHEEHVEEYQLVVLLSYPIV